jgi:hypothetical protein
MIKFYTLLLSAVFCSCGAHLSYLGNSYSPSKKVDVYVDPSAIKKPYTIMGKGYMDYRVGFYTTSKIEKMQAKALEKAKTKGADAILFQDYYAKRDGTNFQTVSRTDSVGKGLVTVETGTVGPVFSSGTTILFLKYDK